MDVKRPISCEGLSVSVSAFMELGVVIKGLEGCEVPVAIKV